MEVSSKFPPLMLLDRIDEVQVTMDQASLQGNLSVTTSSCSLSVESPPILIDQNQACLNYLGLAPGY